MHLSCGAFVNQSMRFDSVCQTCSRRIEQTDLRICPPFESGSERKPPGARRVPWRYLGWSVCFWWFSSLQPKAVSSPDSCRCSSGEEGVCFLTERGLGRVSVLHPYEGLLQWESNWVQVFKGDWTLRSVLGPRSHSVKGWPTMKAPLFVWAPSSVRLCPQVWECWVSSLACSTRASPAFTPLFPQSVSTQPHTSVDAHNIQWNPVPSVTEAEWFSRFCQNKELKCKPLSVAEDFRQQGK